MTELEYLYSRKARADANPAARSQFKDEYDRVCARIKELGGLVEPSIAFALPLDQMPPHLIIDIALIFAIDAELQAAVARGDSEAFREASRRWTAAWLELIGKDRAERGKFEELPPETVQQVFKT